MVVLQIECFFFFFFSSRRRHTRCREVSWARRCVQETDAEYMGKSRYEVLSSFGLLFCSSLFKHKVHNNIFHVNKLIALANKEFKQPARITVHRCGQKAEATNAQESQKFVDTAGKEVEAASQDRESYKENPVATPVLKQAQFRPVLFCVLYRKEVQ
eukprot:TRINITY_DN3380_c0_g1_i1.p1 TRINITY_DN3380_c0_g1~~TRINITY_DN3380_c0_g1_i1.p1  ORF type:complete len:157 (-),score=49.70 TRINITY_DN3380_c0_g1_i1:104-574(-)